MSNETLTITMQRSHPATGKRYTVDRTFDAEIFRRFNKVSLGEDMRYMIEKMHQQLDAKEKESDGKRAANNPTFSKNQLSQAVEACCTCGGGGPGEKHTCPACEVYHWLK
jgi:hypothetical protein